MFRFFFIATNDTNNYSLYTNKLFVLIRVIRGNRKNIH